MNIIPWGVLVFGLLVIGAAFYTFWRKGQGFGINNLRVVGLILVSTFASVLALTNAPNLNIAIGLLGAIAGYLFGVSAKED
jgi:hypothetical protein